MGSKRTKMLKIFIALIAFQLFFLTVTEEVKSDELTFLSKEIKSKTQDILKLDTDEACWLRAVGRGVGKPIHTCGEGLVQSGLLCYPPCRQNFTGVGPVCWQNCQFGFRDDGAFCFKTPAYGRGVGYFLWNKDKCEAENSQGCEKTDYYITLNADPDITISDVVSVPQLALKNKLISEFLAPKLLMEEELEYPLDAELIKNTMLDYATQDAMLD